MDEITAVRERLAEEIYSVRCDWIKDLLFRCRSCTTLSPMEPMDLIIPRSVAARLAEKLQHSYRDLPSSEKEGARVEANLVLPIFQPLFDEVLRLRRLLVEGLAHSDSSWHERVQRELEGRGEHGETV